MLAALGSCKYYVIHFWVILTPPPSNNHASSFEAPLPLGLRHHWDFFKVTDDFLGIVVRDELLSIHSIALSHCSFNDITIIFVRWYRHHFPFVFSSLSLPLLCWPHINSRADSNENHQRKRRDRRSLVAITSSSVNPLPLHVIIRHLSSTPSPPKTWWRNTCTAPFQI